MCCTKNREAREDELHSLDTGTARRWIPTLLSASTFRRISGVMATTSLLFSSCLHLTNQGPSDTNVEGRTAEAKSGQSMAILDL